MEIVSAFACKNETHTTHTTQSNANFHNYFLSAILIYRGLRYTRKRTLKISHASIFGTIMILVLFASWAVYDSHVLKKPNPIPNLYSLHSWIGLAAIILFVLQVLIHVVEPNASPIRKKRHRERKKFI